MDQVILVDQQDNEVGRMDKVEAHRGEGKLHRAISVFLFNDRDELLVQQRSEKKIVGALQWANTCCGNVRPGETYEQCAHRRLLEELGIKSAVLQPTRKFEYHVRCNDEFSEYELDTVFVGKFNGQVDPNPDEVASYRWISWQGFVDAVDTAEFVPWNKVMKEKDILKSTYKYISNLL